MVSCRTVCLTSPIRRLNPYARHMSSEPSFSSIQVQSRRLYHHLLSDSLLFHGRHCFRRSGLQLRLISASAAARDNKLGKISLSAVNVWEQTVSSSSIKPTSTPSDQNCSNFVSSQGRVYYRPTKKGWERTIKTDESSPLRSKISLFKSKDMSFQNIPFIHHFLPANYPHSVCPSYTRYASYCFAGSIAGSAAMVLSTQALLVAVGVGTQSAAPMAAALNWVMKDGVGQLGGVIFASQLGKGGIDVGHWKSKLAKWTGGTRHSKGNFQTGTADSNPKRWRIVAAIALDCSTLLEICTPMMGPQWFLPCASIANVGKNVGFLAASASRATIHQSLCIGGSNLHSKSVDKYIDKMSETKMESNGGDKKFPNEMSFNNNLGDVTAKSGSQAIVASLLGTAIGILLSQTFCSTYGTMGVLAGFIVLSTVHQVCTYRALRAVPLKSLDRHRLHICLSEYITKNKGIIFPSKGIDDGRRSALTPMDVCQRDFFLPLIPPDESVNWLTIGTPLQEICPTGADELESLLIPIADKSMKIKNLADGHKYENYIIKLDPSDGTVLLSFLDGATENDILKAMLHVYIIHEMTLNNDRGFQQLNASNEIVRNAYSITRKEVSLFSDHLRYSGWEIGTGYISVECGSSYRIGIETRK